MPGRSAIEISPYRPSQASMCTCTHCAATTEPCRVCERAHTRHGRWAGSIPWPYTASVAPPSKQRRATVHDVAAAAGISRGTVSRVLNGGYVSAEARAAIEAAIAEVGYVPNTAARNLVMRRSQAVGFLALEPHSLLLDDPNIGAIMLGANEVLSMADHQMGNLVVDS